MLSVMATSSPAERTRKKSLGAFYSPLALVEPMVAWGVTCRGQSVLDPSCGDGIFLETAGRRILELGASREEAATLLHAVDINPEAAQFTRERLRSQLGLPFSNVRVASFFSVPPPARRPDSQDGVDLVLGNPPYIRYQEFSGAARSEALERTAEAGVPLNRLASSWAHFVVHAMAFLRPGGRLALILPAELIHATYAAPVRKHLRCSFADISVVSFRQAVFPQVQEEVVLLLAAGSGQGPGRLRLAEVESSTELADLASVLDHAETFAPSKEPVKWVPGHSAHPAATALDSLRHRGLLIPLGSLGKANIGFVSGANEFFVLTPDEAAEWQLPESSLRPALVRARQIPGLRITAGDLARGKSQGDRCLLWTPPQQLNRAEKAYVRRGERLGFAERYKCRVRSPWYRVPGVLAPDAFLTYMSDRLPRLCLNEADAVSSNTLLTVRLPEVPSPLKTAFVAAFYNSATLLSCERIGRSYGGGVLKLEPREADRVLMPSINLVTRHRRALAKLATSLDDALRAADESRIHEAVAAVDSVLFHGEEVGKEEMASARTGLRERRLGRSKSNQRRADQPQLPF